MKSPTPARIMIPRLLLIATALMLMLIGLVMIYSASSVTALVENDDSAFYFKNQLEFIAIGIVLVIISAAIPLRIWQTKLVWIVWLLLVLLLVYTATAGLMGFGAQRWVAIGPIRFQPSEFAKIAVILGFANCIILRRSQTISFKRFLLYTSIVVGVPVVFIILQPDMGTAMIVLMVSLAVLWFGEVNFKPIILCFPAIIVVGVVGILAEPYRIERVRTFLDPTLDPSGAGYQVLNSLYAFGSGGLTGVGLGMSHQKYLYLPQAYNDFIFAVIGEELGFLGAFSVIALFIVFIYAGIQISRTSTSLFGRIIAGASTTVIGLQAFLNIACTLGFFPVTGKPLPFISSGGSSLLATLILTGLILAVSFQWRSSDEHREARMNLRVFDGNQIDNNDDDYESVGFMKDDWDGPMQKGHSSDAHPPFRVYDGGKSSNKGRR